MRHHSWPRPCSRAAVEAVAAGVVLSWSLNWSFLKMEQAALETPYLGAETCLQGTNQQDREAPQGLGVRNIPFEHTLKTHIERSGVTVEFCCDKRPVLTARFSFSSFFLKGGFYAFVIASRFYAD